MLTLHGKIRTAEFLKELAVFEFIVVDVDAVVDNAVDVFSSKFSVEVVLNSILLTFLYGSGGVRADLVDGPGVRADLADGPAGVDLVEQPLVFNTRMCGKFAVTHLPTCASFLLSSDWSDFSLADWSVVLLADWWT